MATKIGRRIAAALYMLSLGTAPLWAQSQSTATPAVSAPPALVQVTGTLVDSTGRPLDNPLPVAFSVYKESSGGTPLWQEVHTVTLDTRGRYTVLLGSATDGGIPADLFAGAEARWLGIQPDGAAESERRLWTSVPYALKAADASTVGGLPASAFVQKGVLPGISAKSTTASGNITTERGIVPLDAVVADDQIVQGRLCVGLDCVNGEAFGAETTKLKTGDTPAVRFLQTASGGWPTYTWDLGANEYALFVRDVSGGNTYPFRILHGAPDSSFFINTSGNVGVGTGSPAARLQVNGGETRLQNGNGSYSHFNYAGTSVNYIRGATYFDSGNVGIGTAAPAARLHVSGGELRVSNGNGTATHFNYVGTSINYVRGTTNFDNAPVYFTGGNIGIGTTSPAYPLHMGSGAHVTVGGVWTDASSRTLKQQIAPLPLTDAETALAALQPVSYVYKADPADRHVGFIAEDVPELVATPDRKSLAPMDIVAVLTKVLQDQRGTIGKLNATVENQQAMIGDLRGMVGELKTVLQELQLRVNELERQVASPAK